MCEIFRLNTIHQDLDKIITGEIGNILTDNRDKNRNKDSNKNLEKIELICNRFHLL